MPSKEGPTFTLLEKLTAYSKTLAALPVLDDDATDQLRTQLQQAMTSVLTQLGDSGSLGGDLCTSIDLAVLTLLKLFPGVRHADAPLGGSALGMKTRVDDRGAFSSLIIMSSLYGRKITVTIDGLAVKPTDVEVRCGSCCNEWHAPSRHSENAKQCPRCKDVRQIQCFVPADRVEP